MVPIWQDNRPMQHLDRKNPPCAGSDSELQGRHRDGHAAGRDRAITVHSLAQAL
jgi:hypothetical protein